MKITKYLSVLVLILISLLLTAFSYAYWADGITTPSITKSPINGETISIGKAKGVKAVINVSEIQDVKRLVPDGRVDDSVGGEENNTDELVLTIPVTWEEDGSTQTKGIEGTLTISNTKINFTDTDVSHNDLLQLKVTPVSETITLGGNPVEVIVKITMDEPKTKSVYDAIKNQDLILTLDFSVSEN